MILMSGPELKSKLNLVVNLTSHLHNFYLETQGNYKGSKDTKAKTQLKLRHLHTG